MGSSVARFTSSREYAFLAIAGLVGAMVSSWVAMDWAPGWIATALFLLSSGICTAFFFRPAIEIQSAHLVIGQRAISWTEIRSLDQIAGPTPLVVRLTLQSGEVVTLIHAGSAQDALELLGYLGRFPQIAAGDSTPVQETSVQQTWTGVSREPQPAPRANTPHHNPLLSPEDEREVEQIYQRLRSVGNLESKDSSEED